MYATNGVLNLELHPRFGLTMLLCKPPVPNSGFLGPGPGTRPVCVYMYTYACCCVRFRRVCFRSFDHAFKHGARSVRCQTTPAFTMFCWVEQRTSYRNRCATYPASLWGTMLKMRLWKTNSWSSSSALPSGFEWV